jgi:hypothetical protein
MVDGSGALAPVVLARNTSALGTTVNGRLVVSRAGGLVEAFALASRSLDAGETAVIDLGAAWSQAQQIADATGVGVEFEYASAPGTVVMSAMTTSSDLSRTYQVPLIDPETPPSSTGGYPWRAAVGQDDGGLSEEHDVNAGTVSPPDHLARRRLGAGLAGTRAR